MGQKYKMTTSSKSQSAVHLILTVVFGSAILYMLTRLRTLEKELATIRQKQKQAVNTEDVVDIAAHVIAQRLRGLMFQKGATGTQNTETGMVAAPVKADAVGSPPASTLKKKEEIIPPPGSPTSVSPPSPQ